MNDSEKKWSVTYTKQIKQKRKVYKDGYLHLNTSTNKLRLLDDSQNLLECRLLKTDELVSPGETLSFQSYLVDVSIETKKESKVDEVPRVIHRKKFKSPTIYSGIRKENREEIAVKIISDLSSSEKVIREFKKREFERYGVAKCSPDTSNSRVKEWQVLYTTHLTQKAKKYHDGFLQLGNPSFGRQIHLYDACHKLLTSRFLRTGESLVSGESISLDDYLVEIGEPQENHKPKVDLNLERSNCNSNEEITTRLAQESKQHIDIPDRKEEWQVLYTTQLTQKAKKYHEGFLTLENCGSLTQKIMLYDSSKTLVNSRFLKKDEMIRNGESIAFDAHLVDIGEPVENRKPKEDFKAKGHDFDASGKTLKTKTIDNWVEAKKLLEKDTMGKPQNMACFKQDLNSTKTSGIDCTTSANSTTTKPLRDAKQILAFLQRPVGIESNNSMCSSAKTVAATVSCAKGHESSKVVKEEFEECRPSRAPPPNYGRSENLDAKESNMTTHIGKTSFLSSSKVTTFCSNVSISSNSEEKIHQSQLGNRETGTVNYDEPFDSCIKELSSAQTNGPHDQPKSSEPIEMDEWPSFDLGF